MLTEKEPCFILRVVAVWDVYPPPDPTILALVNIISAMLLDAMPRGVYLSHFGLSSLLANQTSTWYLNLVLKNPVKSGFTTRRYGPMDH